MGALLSLCDGLIWSELGTAYPEAGGSYAYLKHLYGEKTSAAHSRFSTLGNCSSAHRSPSRRDASASRNISPSSSHNAAHPFASASLFGVPIVLSGQTLIAMSACCIAIAVLYRSIFAIDRIVRWLGFGRRSSHWSSSSSLASPTSTLIAHSTSRQAPSISTTHSLLASVLEC